MKQSKLLQQLQRKENYIKNMPINLKGDWSKLPKTIAELQIIEDMSQPTPQPMEVAWDASNTTTQTYNSTTKWLMERGLMIEITLLLLIIFLSVLVSVLLIYLIPSLLGP